MKYLIVLLLALLLAKESIAEDPYRCQTPPNWEADQMLRYIGKPDKDKEYDFFYTGRYYQDAERARTAVVEDIHVSDKEDYYWTITHYFHEEHHNSTSIEYVINMKTKDCEYQELDELFHPVEIPKTAKHKGSVFFGSEGERDGSLEVNVFVDAEEGHDEKVRYESIFTTEQEGCFPVEEHVREYDEDDKYAFDSIINYFNIVKGISTPNVFEPPSDCRKKQN